MLWFVARRLADGVSKSAFAVLVAQVGLAIPAVLTGLFEQDLSTSASPLTWISDAFLVPITLLELTLGVRGDPFGRRRLLLGGAALMAAGEIISVLTPGVDRLSRPDGNRTVGIWQDESDANVMLLTGDSGKPPATGPALSAPEQ